MSATLLSADRPDVIHVFRHNGTTLVDVHGGEEFTASGTVAKAPSNVSGVYASDHRGAGIFVGDGTAQKYATQKALTVEAVVNQLTFAGSQYIAWCGGDTTSGTAGNNASWALGVKSATGELRYVHEHTTGTAVTVDATDVLPIGQWCHVAFTRNAAGTEVKLYVNGSLVKTSTGLTAPDGGGYTAGTADIGTGANGTVTVTVGSAAEGAAGNDISVVVESDLNPPLGKNRPLSVSFDGVTLKVKLAVTAGALATAANTATLVAAAIDALDGFSASASGTGADSLTTAETVAVTGGVSPIVNIGGAAASDTYDFEGLVRDVRITKAVRTDAQLLAAAQAALGS